MPTFNNIAVSLTDSWWKKSLLFLSIFLIIEKSLFFLISMFWIPSPIAVSIIILFATLISSFLIEQFRPNSKWYYIGFFYDRTILGNFSTIIIISFTSFIIISLVLVLSGSLPKLNPKFEIWAVIIMSIQIFIMAFYEELLFRGIIFQSMLERFGEVFPTIVISLIFALFHLFNPEICFIAFVNLFFAGILFSIVFIQTRSILLVTIVHFFWNIFQVALLGWNVSGIHYPYGIFIFPSMELPYWLSGGYFGLEATPLLSIILLFNIILLNKYLKKSPFISSLLMKREYLKYGINI